MPPKLSEAAIDARLDAVRDYVRDHREQLASRGNSCLRHLFAGRRNGEETRLYLFMYKNEARFTYDQRRHAHETLGLLRPPEASGNAAQAADRARDAGADPGGDAQRNEKEQPHVESSGWRPQKRLRLEGPGGDAQLAADSGVLRPETSLRGAACAVEANSPAPVNAAKSGDSRTLLLQLKRPHYDAIKRRRKQWEARPLFDKPSKGGRPSLFGKLGNVGRTVVLQSGANTNDRVRVAEVRRFCADPDASGDPVKDMVLELGAALLPDVADPDDRVKVYKELYGAEQCSRGFVAMRLEWPPLAS